MSILSFIIVVQIDQCDSFSYFLCFFFVFFRSHWNNRIIWWLFCLLHCFFVLYGCVCVFFLLITKILMIWNRTKSKSNWLLNYWTENKKKWFVHSQCLTVVVVVVVVDSISYLKSFFFFYRLDSVVFFVVVVFFAVILFDEKQ